jgi:hypothetical protein
MQAVPPQWLSRAGTIITFLVLIAALCLIWITGVSSIRHLVANLIGSYVIIWGLALLLVKVPRAELATRFALSSLALGVFFLVLEATAFIGGVDYRHVFGQSIDRARWQGRYHAFDPELGWVAKPHMRLVGTTPGGIALQKCLDSPLYSYDVRLDRHGFRNEVDLDAADVAVIGDSFIEAMETPNDQILPSALARLTGGTVANLGLSAYGPQQQLIVLKRYALPLRPKVIVWMFYEGNDLHDLDTYDSIMAGLRTGDIRVAPSAYERSFVVAALTGLFRVVRGCEPAPADYFASGVFRTAEGQNVQMHFLLHGNVPSDTWSPQHDVALARTRDLLQQAHAVTRREGTAFVVAFIPLGFRVYKNLVQCTESRCAESDLNDLPKRLGKAVRGISETIRYVDLTSPLVAAARRGRLVYLPDDTHWSAEGHHVVAEALAEAIRPLVEKAVTPREAGGAPLRQRAMR